MTTEADRRKARSPSHPGGRPARYPRRNGSGRGPRIVTGLALAVALGTATGEIYRYRDADGRWQFTDRPPPGQVATGAGSPEASVIPPRDLEARLRARFEPSTPVQESSLAVVVIESEIGTGSGFFVSPDGLILTNRHVVRPSENWADEWERKLERMKAGLDKLEDQLGRPRSTYVNKDDYDEGKRILRVKSREYRTAKLDLDIKRHSATLQSGFSVALKGGMKLSANLIDISAGHDLALLQLKGYRTPYLSPLSGRRLEQGETVYAIGSPLGIADTITKGIFTSRRDGLLVTDARILPGNSGGPMVTEGGEAVGVNVLKVTPRGQPATGRGFGLAIPIGVALDAFPRIRQR